MLNLQTISYRPLSSHSNFIAESFGNDVKVKDDNGNSLHLSCVTVNDELKMELRRNNFFLNDDALMVAVEYVLSHHPELQKICITGFQGVGSENILKKYFLKSEEILLFSRSSFYQLRGIWHRRRDYTTLIEDWTTSSDNRLHPIRPDIQSGVMYARYLPRLGAVLSFRVIDKVRDLENFFQWHNQPRVAQFWDLAMPKMELLQYMEKVLSDAHTLPMIAEWDGEPVGYFEMYWTREDRLAPYYESESFDRGFHFLIGNRNFLGFSNTDAILKSLTHFLFIDEVRTRRIMAEPRSDNNKVMKYLETFKAWKKLYEFDFPHKRAALLECKREDFFMGDYL